MWLKIFPIIRRLLPFLKNGFKRRPKAAHAISLLSLGLLFSVALNLTFLVGNQSLNHIRGVGVIGSTISSRIVNPKSLYQKIQRSETAIADNGGVAGVTGNRNVIATGPDSQAIGEITTGDLIGSIDQATTNIINQSLLMSNWSNTPIFSQTIQSIIASANQINNNVYTLQSLGCRDSSLKSASPDDKPAFYTSVFLEREGLQSIPIPKQELLDPSNRGQILKGEDKSEEECHNMSGAPNRSRWDCCTGDHLAPKSCVEEPPSPT